MYTLDADEYLYSFEGNTWYMSIYSDVEFMSKVSHDPNTFRIRLPITISDNTSFAGGFVSFAEVKKALEDYLELLEEECTP